VPPRPDRVLFPESGFKKSDAIRYYRAVARFLLPHLKNRPVSFKRYPDTIRGESFWEKDAPSFTPSWVRRVSVPRRGEGEADIEYILINDTKTLAWIADVGGVELHPFLHVAPKIELATAVVFDLDPGEGADILDCAKVALLLRDALQGIGLESFAKVSGSKGIQVYVPVRGTPHEVTEPFARVVADELARAHPKRIVSKMARSLRHGKVFIDWSQNADYKTTVAVYSLRAKSVVPYVSMPVRWEELAKPKRSALSWEPEAALQRLKKLGDLFAPVLRLRQSLPYVEERRSRPSGQARSPVPHDLALPKPSSQSGRRLFVLVQTDMGNELWLDMHGKFKRWILRPDREGRDVLMAMPAGDFPIDRAYYRGEVPAAWKGRVQIEDTGAYEVIEGSYDRRRFDLWFNGRVLGGEWILEKVSEDASHRSWRLER
jgi:bifunctional non-homologous end joining protein LigD